MGVYVDDMRPVKRNKNWPYDTACHLIADTHKELMYFALFELDLKRGWLQKGTMPHFDLTENKRSQALRLGALAITDRRLVEMIKHHRKRRKE